MKKVTTGRRTTNDQIRACLSLRNPNLRVFFCLKKKIKKQTNRGPPRVSGAHEQCKKLTKIGS